MHPKCLVKVMLETITNTPHNASASTQRRLKSKGQGAEDVPLLGKRGVPHRPLATSGARPRGSLPPATLGFWCRMKSGHPVMSRERNVEHPAWEVLGGARAKTLCPADQKPLRDARCSRSPRRAAAGGAVWPVLSSSEPPPRQGRADPESFL